MVTVKPYVAMKNSGVEWLGDVPAHWEVRAIKTVLREKDHRSQDGGEPLLSLTRGRGIVPHSEVSTRPAGASDRSGYKLCNPGDLVMNRMQAWSGMFALATLRGLISPDYSVFSPRRGCEVHVAFLENLFKTPVFVDQFAKRSKGIGSGFNRLYTPNFGAVPCVVPPPAEQRAIIRFLDHAGRRIQRYIRAKERLIELLEEQKQAIIHQAVTGQIDFRTGQPYPAYKDSGVEWLGEVPEHWGVRRLRSLATIGTGGRDTINRKADGLYPFFVRSQTVERIDTWSFDGEAVLTAGDGVGVGKVCHYVNGKFDYHQRVYKFSDFSHTLGQFFFHYFRSTLRNEVFQGTAKSTVDSLRLPMLQNFPVALPPLSEQAPIVEYLDKGAAGIDAAITRAQRQIDLLREYRTRLIADVVTGKVDVRAAAASLPEVNLLAVAEASDEAAELSPKLHQLEDDSATKPPHP